MCFVLSLVAYFVFLILLQSQHGSCQNNALGAWLRCNPTCSHISGCVILCVGFQDVPQQFNTKQEYVYQDELYGLEGRPLNPLARNHLLTHPEDGASTSGRGEGVGVHYGPQWGLLTLSQPVTASEVSCCMPLYPPRCPPPPPRGVHQTPLCMIVSLDLT